MECDLLSIIVLAQFPWVLWACLHMWEHRKEAQKEGFDSVSVAEDFRKQFERDQINMSNLSERIRHIEKILDSLNEDDV